MIHLDIQWFLANCDNVDNVVAFITKSVQAELREIYPGVLPEEEISLSESLSRIKNIVGQKFIIIIDEWDVLIRDEAANKKVQENISSYPALVVELKWNKSAKTALQQIKERKYPESIKQYTGDILLVGINYDKKTKKHQCLMESYEKQER